MAPPVRRAWRRSGRSCRPKPFGPSAPDNPYWIWHKAFAAFGADNWMGSAQYLRLFGALPDLETTVRCSQFVQAEALRYADQAMRRFRWHRSACASWTYNEPWPNASHGCIVEYSGRPKMAYYYVKQAYAPVDVLAVYSSLSCEAGKPLSAEIWATQDGLTDLRDFKCRYRIFSSRGDLCAEKDADLPSSSGGQRKGFDRRLDAPARHGRRRGPALAGITGTGGRTLRVRRRGTCTRSAFRAGPIGRVRRRWPAC